MAAVADSTLARDASRHVSPDFVPPSPPAFLDWARAMIADGWRFVPRPGGFYLGAELVPTPAVPSFPQWSKTVQRSS
jgi:hypothetical protein